MDFVCKDNLRYLQTFIDSGCRKGEKSIKQIRGKYEQESKRLSSLTLISYIIVALVTALSGLLYLLMF